MTATAMALVLVGCTGERSLTGDTGTHQDSWEEPSWDIPGEPAEDVPMEYVLDTSTWECATDEECDDGDGCTIDACGEDHHCSHSRTTGFGFRGEPVRVSETPFYSHLGEMAWTGSAIAMAFEDGRDDECTTPPGPLYCNMELYLKAISPAGEDLSAPSRLTDTPDLEQAASLVWTGSEYWVGWRRESTGLDDDYGILVTRTDVDGHPVGEPMEPGGGAAGLSLDLAWSGSRMAALVQTGYSDPDSPHPSELHVTLFSADGDLISDVLLETREGCACWMHPALAWNGSMYGAVWNEEGVSHLWMQLLDTDGAKVGSGIAGPYDPHEDPMVTWTGSEFVAFWSTWRDEIGSDAFLSRFDETASEMGETLRVSHTPNLSNATGLAWTGSELGLAYWDETGSGAFGYMVRTTPTGEVIGEPIAVPSPAQLVWTGSEYVIGWSDESTGNYEIYLQRLGFCE